MSETCRIQRTVPQQAEGSSGLAVSRLSSAPPNWSRGDPMNRDNRVSIMSADIAANIGGDISRRMLAAGYAPGSVFDEAFEACENAALVLDRITAYEIAREAGDDDSADSLLNAAIHFRACMLRRLPDTVDLRIIPGDAARGVEVINRGEPHDYRP